MGRKFIEPVIISFIFMILFGVSSHADRSETAEISLARAIEIAYWDNPNLKAARSQLKAAENQVKIARSNFLPRLDVEQTYVRTDQQVMAFGITLNQGSIQQSDFNPALLNEPDKVTDYGTSVIISQPIFNGGKEWLGYQLSKRGYISAQAETRSAVETVLFETVKAYLGAVLAREGKSVASEALTTAEKNLEMIRHLYTEGMIIKSDLLQAEVHVANLRQQEVTARHQFNLALAGLNTILGHPQGHFFPSDSLKGGTCQTLELTTLIDWAMKDRPELQSLRAKEEAAKLMVKLAQSNYLPNLNAQGTYAYHGTDIMSDGADSVMLAVSLKFNLLNGTGDFYRVKQAKSQLEGLKKMLISKENMVSLDVQKALLELQSASDRLVAMTEAVEQAEESLRIISQRYREGAAGIVDLLRSEVALSSARFNRLQAKHDLLLGNAELCRSVGHLYTRWMEPDKCPIPPVNIQQASAEDPAGDVETEPLANP